MLFLGVHFNFRDFYSHSPCPSPSTLIKFTGCGEGTNGEELSNMTGTGCKLMKHFLEDNIKIFWMEKLWINYPKGTEKAPY